MNNANIVCQKCQQPIPPINEHDHNGNDKPCSNCGSLERLYKITLCEGVTTSESMDTQVFKGPLNLLDQATCLVDAGHYGPAIIIANVAYKVALKRRKQMKRASKSGRNSNKGEKAERLKKDIEAIGVEIAHIENWSEFVDATFIRDEIVHEGRDADKYEASNAIKAIKNIIEHIRNVDE